MGFEDEVVLYFLVAGHTKNVCDGTFGHVKRNILKTDAITPAQMMDVVKSSSKSTQCVPGNYVKWLDW